MIRAMIRALSVVVSLIGFQLLVDGTGHLVRVSEVVVFICSRRRGPLALSYTKLALFFEKRVI